jgi:hypothetical protein
MVESINTLTRLLRLSGPSDRPVFLLDHYRAEDLVLTNDTNPLAYL